MGKKRKHKRKIRGKEPIPMGKLWTEKDKDWCDL